MLLRNINNFILNKLKNEDETWIRIVPQTREQNIGEWTILCSSKEFLSKEYIEVI
jgi:hypothetical protein